MSGAVVKITIGDDWPAGGAAGDDWTGQRGLLAVKALLHSRDSNLIEGKIGMLWRRN